MDRYYLPHSVMRNSYKSKPEKQKSLWEFPVMSPENKKAASKPKTRKQVITEEAQRCEQIRRAEQTARESSARKKAEDKRLIAEEGHERCPCCGRVAQIVRSYFRETYTISEHKVVVRSSRSECKRCGRIWANGAQTGLDRAYTIYFQRVNPSARKFQKVLFTSGQVRVEVCSSCAITFGLDPKKLFPTHGGCCFSKGCSNKANHQFSFGKME